MKVVDDDESHYRFSTVPASTMVSETLPSYTPSHGSSKSRDRLSKSSGEQSPMAAGSVKKY